jgi:primosomal protein N' (replication factor Y)
MYVISVVPLKRGIALDTLSYFSIHAYEEGTILSIPIRSTLVLGLVTDAKEVSTAKTALRAATFSLRKLPVQPKARVLGKAYIQTAEELSRYYATSFGTVLYNLLAPEIRSGDIPIPHTHNSEITTQHKPQILQASKKDRFLAYRSLVRETFAHSGSVLIVVPSSSEACEVRDALQQGIQDRIIMLTTASTKSELQKAYTLLDDFSKTKLIIATSSHAVIERHDITHVVIEHSRSSYYKEFTRPYLDYRTVLTIHARNAGRHLILADTLIRAEEEFLRREEEYGTFGETPKRIELSGKLEVVDMTPNPLAQTPFTLFSEETIQAIKDAQERRGHIFLFAARRGLAPMVGCIDCGFIFRSAESGAPYSLIRTNKNGVEERWFVCGTSGERIRAHDTCTQCGSWRLRERGIGVQQVYDELHKIFPHAPIILFDHITARTYKKATFLRDTFYKTQGAILLGTHMAVPYLTHDVDLSVVVNMDALLATPTWRLEEENLALLLSLREVTTGFVLIQTRTPKAEILTHAKHGTVESFYTEELELRQAFNYPPFATFIHLTWQGAPEVVKKIESDITVQLAEFEISTYLNPTSPSATPIMHGLLRIPSITWPNPKLVSLLKQIHPSVRIMINPDKIV